MISDVSLRDIAQWRWKSILTEFGIDPKMLNPKHGPCPLCGGHDRFRFDDKDGRGTFFCSQCGPGDGFMLLERKTNQKFKDLAGKIKEIAGLADQDHHQQVTYEDPTKHMRAIWRRATPPRDGGPVANYLAGRLKGRTIGIRAAIREAKVWHHESRSMFWCMVSQVTTQESEVANLHLTYLTDKGDIAQVTPNKRVMKGGIPAGSAIRLSKGGEVLGIAEGIETALSCEVMFNIPVWSALNAVNLSKWTPPYLVKKIIIFSDNDLNYTGQSKAYALANTLAIKGRDVEVKVPPRPGTDWNDELS